MIFDADTWNDLYPVGTPVRYFLSIPPKESDEIMDTKTLSTASTRATGVHVVQIEGWPDLVPLVNIVPLERGAISALGAIAYIAEVIGGIAPESQNVAAMQVALTEIHCTCMRADPRTDPDSPMYQRSVHPSLLERAMALFKAAREFDELDDLGREEIDDWCKDAQAILNPE